MNEQKTMERYLESCKDDFWKPVFEAETDYLAKNLAGCKDVLSVGCGPAIIENALSQRGFNVTGLDVSQEALDRAGDAVTTVVGSAEDLPFPDSRFDAVIFVASLQFIEDYKKAVASAARVLRSGGRVIVMSLNPESAFYMSRTANPNSYMRRIKHTDLKDIEASLMEKFSVESEFFLGIKDNTVFESGDPRDAALFVIRGSRISDDI